MQDNKSINVAPIAIDNSMDVKCLDGKVMLTNIKEFNLNRSEYLTHLINNNIHHVHLDVNVKLFKEFLEYMINKIKPTYHKKKYKTIVVQLRLDVDFNIVNIDNTQDRLVEELLRDLL